MTNHDQSQNFDAMKIDERYEGFVDILYRFAITVAIGIAVCGVLSLCVGCSRKQYIPLQSEVVRVDTVTRIDTVIRTRTDLRIDTVFRERVVSVKVLDSIVPRYTPDGRLEGYDRYRYEKETDSSREERARLTALADSLRQVAATSDIHKDTSRQEVAVPVSDNRPAWRFWIVMTAFAAGIGYLLWRFRKK